MDYVPAPHSILEGVGKLEAGELLVWRGGRTVHRRKYWELEFGEPPLATDGELAHALWELLSDAVRLRLRSDVPLGVFLSGGIDSTAVTLAMAEHMPASQIRTFSIGFRDPSFDESSHARTVARHIGTHHDERILEPEMVLDLLPGILATIDEPLADGSLVPTYLLSAFAREHVKVVLGGDGGDELFLGYPTFLAHRPARLYRHVPGWLHRHVVRPLADRLPVSTANISLDYQVKRFLVGYEYDAVARHFVWIGSFDPLAQRDLLMPDVLRKTRDLDVFEDVHTALRGRAVRDDFDALSFAYARFYMGDDILAKVDRASMAHALEVRAPLLDHRIAQFAANLPTRLKLRGRTTKVLLREAVRGRVPESITERPKKGFGIPIAEWLKGPLLPWARSLLAPDRLGRFGLIRPEAAQRILDEHTAGRRDQRKLLWSLLVLQLWLEHYGP
jgi:asparagine synthase (glutamine-hydrolysing)